MVIASDQSYTVHTSPLKRREKLSPVYFSLGKAHRRTKNISSPFGIHPKGDQTSHAQYNAANPDF
jgi:hypothetical protein